MPSIVQYLNFKTKYGQYLSVSMKMKQLIEISHRRSIIRTLLYPAIIIRRLFLKIRYMHKKEVLDNLGKVLVGDPVIAVDEFEGLFAVDVHSDLFIRIISEKHYEPELVKICKRYLDVNKDVIDVGANIGFYTIMFAKNIAQQRVLSIEPTQNAINRLRRNIELNGVANKVEVFEGAVSNRQGKAIIKTIKGKEEYSSLGEMIHPAISNEKWDLEEVISETLDELVRRKSLNPGFLKVDVEGVEHLIFSGAREVLSEHRPIILSEVSELLLRNNSSSSKTVIDSIKSYEYDVLDPTQPSIQPGTKDFGNILCIPKEMNIRNEN